MTSKFCGYCGRPLNEPAAYLPPSAADPTRPEPSGSPIWVQEETSTASRPSRFPFAGGNPRQWWVAGAAALVIVLIVTGVAVWLTNRAAERPAVEAIEGAQAEFAAVLTTLADAQTLEEWNAAGTTAEAQVPKLQEHLDILRSENTETALASAPIVAAELEATQSVTQLQEMAAGSLDIWAGVRRTLLAEHDAIAQALPALAQVSTDVAATVPDVDAAVSDMETAMGPLLVAHSQDALVAMLADLGKAPDTIAVRKVAGNAAQLHALLTDAEEGLADGPDAEVVAAVGAVVGELQQLAGLDAENLDVWQQVRGPLLAALAETSGGNGTQTTGDPDTMTPDVEPLPELTWAQGQNAIDALDALVANARETLSAWKVSYDQAVTDKKKDAAALRTYAAEVRSQLKVYNTMRADTSAFFDRVEAPGSYVSWDEAFSELEQGVWDRESIRSTLLYMSVPSGMQGAHDGLVALLDHAISAMQRGYDSVDDAFSCRTTCNYRDTQAYAEFSAESQQISTEFTAAEQAWESAIMQVQTEVSTRQLPRKPVV